MKKEFGARSKIIERAVSNGRTEVQAYRFPNKLCTDKGRAINQQEPGRGYKLKVEIIDFPGGLPGDVGMTLKWG